MSEANPSEVSSNSDAELTWQVEIHIFACGHGDTLLLRFPGGENHLIDCCLPKRDGTRDRFFQYLVALGVKRLDSVFLTHPDQDHLLGMAEVIQHFVDEQEGVGFFRTGGNRHCNVLLAGDAGTSVLESALLLWTERAADMGKPHHLNAVKVPHHGSSHSHTPRLSAREAQSPAVRLAAVSAGDRQALPDQRVLADYLENGWRVLLTRPRRRPGVVGPVLTHLAIDLADRTRNQPAAPLRHHDIVIRWDSKDGLRFEPSTSEIKAAELANYEVAAE